MIFNSIKWRLQLWYGLILVAVLAGFGVTAYQLERGRQLRRIDEQLQRRVNALAAALRQPPRNQPGIGEPFRRPPPGEQPAFGPPIDDRPGEIGRPPRGEFRLSSPVANLFDAGDTNGFYYALWTRTGAELAQSENAPVHLSAPKRPTPKNEIPPANAERRPPARDNPLAVLPPWTREEFRELAVITLPGEIILAGRSMKTELGELRLVALKLTTVGGVILLFGLAGGWWLAGRAIRPIDDITATAAKISAGDLSQRINAADTESELGRLAGVLNSTFTRLETTFAQQRQFTSDAAHELRTPVSVILTQVQSTLNKERSGPEYRETLEACQRAAQRMRRLTESLLALARLDAGQEPLKRQRVDLAGVAQECVQLIQPLAAERGVTILTDFEAAHCAGDAGRLAQVITNLLTNAIQYNRENGKVRVTVKPEGGGAIIMVTDTGPGIAADDLPRIFERFFRGDKSRTGSSGNAGLGLAISKAIVDAYGGTIEVVSAPDTGATFTARLPLTE